MDSNKNIGIVGLGLIGGSFALDLKKLGYKIFGFDQNPIHEQKAIDLGIIAETRSLENLGKECDIIIVSIPVQSTSEVLKEMMNQMTWDTVIIDTGSTKQSICSDVRSHTKRGRFVACHPLAGTEFSGPQAAIEGLYEGKKNIICEEHLTDEDALDQTIELFSSLEMQSIFMDPKEHDKHMAYVSHLSHVSAFTLGATVLEIEKDQKQIFNLASTGFESTVRLAKSSPQTWSSIFMDNSENLLTALNSYIKELEIFREILEEKDTEKLKDKITEANEIKRVLNGLKYNIVKLS